MNQLDKNIIETVEEIVKEKGFVLIDLIIRGTTSFKVIEVFIDRESNVSAEDCANISRETKLKLDQFLSVEYNYRLDVSSPGVDRPLKFLAQYSKHVNRNFEISFKINDETKKYKGKLIRLEGDNLIFADREKETIINFNNILKAKVIVSFS